MPQDAPQVGEMWSYRDNQGRTSAVTVCRVTDEIVWFLSLANGTRVALPIIRTNGGGFTFGVMPPAPSGLCHACPNPAPLLFQYPMGTWEPTCIHHAPIGLQLHTTIAPTPATMYEPPPTASCPGCHHPLVARFLAPRSLPCTPPLWLVQCPFCRVQGVLADLNRMTEDWSETAQRLLVNQGAQPDGLRVHLSFTFPGETYRTYPVGDRLALTPPLSRAQIAAGQGTSIALMISLRPTRAPSNVGAPVYLTPQGNVSLTPTPSGVVGRLLETHEGGRQVTVQLEGGQNAIVDAPMPTPPSPLPTVVLVNTLWAARSNPRIVVTILDVQDDLVTFVSGGSPLRMPRADFQREHLPIVRQREPMVLPPGTRLPQIGEEWTRDGLVYRVDQIDGVVRQEVVVSRLVREGSTTQERIALPLFVSDPAWTPFVRRTSYEHLLDD